MTAGGLIALSGGVGGAKLVLGLSHLPEADALTVVTNTGDDFDHFGLRICPDTDTVLYTLGGLADKARGWGREGETWGFMQAMAALGGADWFNLGDADLALHVLRSHRLRAGETLSRITADIAARMGITARILPMSDDPVATIVETPDGPLPFQHYFVRERCAPVATGFAFAGLDAARPNPALIEALGRAPAAILIAPSNPYVSIDPILGLPGLRAAIKASGAPVVAVSPIVGGAAIKGPAAKMMGELGADVSALGIARHYAGLVDGLIVDEADAALVPAIEDLGIEAIAAPTLMTDLASRIALARVTADFAGRLRAPA